MSKVLYVHCVTSHIQNFHIPYLKLFKDNNYEVYVATKGNEEIKYCDYHFNVDFGRSPFSLSNIKALFQMRNIIKRNNFNYIILNGAIGGIIGRLATVFSKSQGKVVYFVHGFPFHDNASFLYNFIYENIEKLLFKLTRIIIVTNKDDYVYVKEYEKKYKIQCYYMPGVGIDIESLAYSGTKCKNFKKLFGFEEKDIVLLTAGEFIKRKNFMLLFEVLSELNDNSIKLLVCGEGVLEKNYKEYIKKNKIEGIRFLGYRNDLPFLMANSDIFVFPSIREGLPVVVEMAMANKLPIIASDIKGNRDLITDGENGYLFTSKKDLINKLMILKNDQELQKEFSNVSLIKIHDYQLMNTLSIFNDIFFKE